MATEVELRKIAGIRLKNAMALISQLRDSYRELEARYRMVETHNLELQELLDKVSADQAVVEKAIDEALQGLEELGSLDSFGTLDLGDLESAEAFTLDGSSDELDTFEEEQ